MLYISIFDAKENVRMDEINRERADWYNKGKDKTFQNMCKKMDRYEFVGKSPMRIIFITETDNPNALNILSRHFGEAWTSVSYPALRREMHEAMEEDRSIVGG